MHVRFFILMALWWSLAVVLTGCGERQEITSYVVPKQHVLDAAHHVKLGSAVDRRTGSAAGGLAGSMTSTRAAKVRMLAAIIPHGKQQWFFKVTGPADEVAKHTETFTTFIKSVRFPTGKSTEPTWTVPNGWQQLPGSGMRFATLRLGPPARPLELTVIPLGTIGKDQHAYTLGNVNRWRGQLGLPPIKQAQLAEQTVELKLDGATATLVDLVGSRAPGGMSRAPFARGRGGPTASVGRGAPAAAPSLRYDTPEGWTKSALGVSRGGVSVDYAAAFKVERAGETLDITVTPFPAAAAGMMLPMINRWRGQIRLGPTTREQLDQKLQKIEIDGAMGDYIEMVGAEDSPRRQTILAVIAVAADRAWFFKLMGDSSLAEAEKRRFEAFVRSVKFDKAQGAGHEN